MSIRKVNITDYIVVYVVYEDTEVVFVGYTELGVFGLAQKTEDFTKVQIITGFKNSAEAKSYQDRLIIKYNPLFNNRLNGSVTFRTLLNIFKKQKPLDVRTYRKIIRELGIELVDYQNIKYIINNEDIFKLCDYIGDTTPITELDLTEEYETYKEGNDKNVSTENR